MFVIKLLAIVLGAAVGVIWLVALSGMVRSLLRVKGAASKPSLLLWSLGAALGGSLMITVNVIGVLIGSAWYKVRGKPLPPWPRPGAPRK